MRIGQGRVWNLAHLLHPHPWMTATTSSNPRSTASAIRWLIWKPFLPTTNNNYPAPSLKMKRPWNPPSQVNYRRLSWMKYATRHPHRRLLSQFPGVDQDLKVDDDGSSEGCMSGYDQLPSEGARILRNSWKKPMVRSSLLLVHYFLFAVSWWIANLKIDNPIYVSFSF